MPNDVMKRPCVTSMAANGSPFLRGYGMRSTLPMLKKSEDIPLAAFSLATEVEFREAMAESVSPFFTV